MHTGFDAGAAPAGGPRGSTQCPGSCGQGEDRGWGATATPPSPAGAHVCVCMCVHVCVHTCACMCTRVCARAHALAVHASVPAETDARGLSPRQVHC